MTQSGRSEIRKRANLTLVKLAAKTGVSRSRLSQWENYETRLRDVEISRIAGVLLDALGGTPKFADGDDLESFLLDEAI
jgi:transcriptional regulator with XRE-family HTH domain